MLQTTQTNINITYEDVISMDKNRAFLGKMLEKSFIVLVYIVVIGSCVYNVYSLDTFKLENIDIMNFSQKLNSLLYLSIKNAGIFLIIVAIGLTVVNGIKLFFKTSTQNKGVMIIYILYVIGTTLTYITWKNIDFTTLFKANTPSIQSFSDFLNYIAPMLFLFQIIQLMALSIHLIKETFIVQIKTNDLEQRFKHYGTVWLIALAPFAIFAIYQLM